MSYMYVGRLCFVHVLYVCRWELLMSYMYVGGSYCTLHMSYMYVGGSY